MSQNLTDFQKDELEAEARVLVNSKALAHVFEEIEKEYVERLKATNIGDLTVPTLHASMRVLEDVKARIQSIVTDGKIRRTRGK